MIIYIYICIYTVLDHSSHLWRCFAVIRWRLPIEKRPRFGVGCFNLEKNWIRNMDLDKEGEESSWLEVAAGETISSWWGSPSHHPAGGTPPKKELDTPWKYGYQYGYEDGGSIDSMVIMVALNVWNNLVTRDSISEFQGRIPGNHQGRGY